MFSNESLNGANARSLPFVRPKAKGKFLYLGDEKFYVKGATYGAFPPNSLGDQFPEPRDVSVDFKLMRAAGINARAGKWM